jgi:hypothetical protein
MPYTQKWTSLKKYCFSRASVIVKKVYNIDTWPNTLMAMMVVVIAVVMVVMVVSVVRVIVVVVVSFPLCNRVVNGVPFKEDVEMGIVVMVMPAVVEAVVVMVVVAEEAVAEVAVVMVVVPVRVGTALYQVGTVNEKLMN